MFSIYHIMLFNFRERLQDRYYYTPHFEEETKIYRDEHSSQGPTTGQ